MPAATDAPSLTNAAEQAAGTGDFAAAEQYLRLVVELQEAGGATMHPDLANTLNNLGVVYERLDRPADAEQCYRRAHAIASAALEADHPFVALSAKNLRDFCAARGIPIEPPASPSALEPSGAVGPDFSRAEEPQFTPPATDAVTRHPPRLAVVVFIGVVALIAIVLATIRWRSTGSPTVAVEPAARPASTPPAAPLAPPRGADQPPRSALRRSAEASAKAEAPPPHVAEAPPPQPHPDAPLEPVASPKRATPTLSEAALCRSVEIRAGEWLCDPAGGAPEPGTFFFYTRVASAGDATIEHRWYRNNRLYQRIPLRVRANQRGFRTYSRMTISAERAGEWRVELRTADGTLLGEERFKVGP